MTPRAYIEIAAVLTILIALAWFGFHERRVGEKVIERQDTQATQQVEIKAIQQSQAAQDKSDTAHAEADNAQSVVDHYMQQHPVTVSLRDAHDSGGCLPEARPLAGGAARTSAGPAAIPAVLGGQQDRALAEILSSASRMAIIDAQRQQRQ